jgi:hypothetical protein
MHDLGWSQLKWHLIPLFLQLKLGLDRISWQAKGAY